MPQDTCKYLLNKHKPSAWPGFHLHFSLQKQNSRSWGRGGEGRVAWGGVRVEGKEGTEVQERRAAMGEVETNSS